MRGIRYLIADARKSKQIFLKHGYPKPTLILTSPPYHDIKNYGNSKNQLGFNQTYEQYLKDVANVFQQCYEISKLNATFWLVVDTIRKNGSTVTLPFDINNKLHELYKNDTWNLKEIIVWNKYKNTPWQAKGRLKNQFEYILFFTKGRNFKYRIDKTREITDYKNWWLTYPERYNSNGKVPSNIWEFTIPIRGWGNSRQEHMCPFPFPLIERILSISSDKGDMIFDPFVGSGSTLALANEMGRRAIGFDVNSKYKREFEEDVLVGARLYWSKRKQELDTVKKKISKFRSINLSLRKLKAGFEIIENQPRNVKRQFLFFALFATRRRAQADLIMVPKSGNQKQLKTSGIQRMANDISEIFRTSISVKTISKQRFNHLFPRRQSFFAYNKDHIFKYLFKMRSKEIVNANGTIKPGLLFSDLKLALDPKNALEKL
ncbi:MAG TPA: site-specific DNA-methyltransferase [Candidatus Acidoferrales bacterium]|nr:site-specific DNA-methyltransferase [Candidatus Acidoferrales bacterium]